MIVSNKAILMLVYVFYFLKQVIIFPSKILGIEMGIQPVRLVQEQGQFQHGSAHLQAQQPEDQIDLTQDLSQVLLDHVQQYIDRKQQNIQQQWDQINRIQPLVDQQLSSLQETLGKIQKSIDNMCGSYRLERSLYWRVTGDYHDVELIKELRLIFDSTLQAHKASHELISQHLKASTELQNVVHKGWQRCKEDCPSTIEALARHEQQKTCHEQDKTRLSDKKQAFSQLQAQGSSRQTIDGEQKERNYELALQKLDTALKKMDQALDKAEKGLNEALQQHRNLIQDVMNEEQKAEQLTRDGKQELEQLGQTLDAMQKEVEDSQQLITEEQDNISLKSQSWSAQACFWFDSFTDTTMVALDLIFLVRGKKFFTKPLNFSERCLLIYEPAVLIGIERIVHKFAQDKLVSNRWFKDYVKTRCVLATAFSIGVVSGAEYCTVAVHPPKPFWITFVLISTFARQVILNLSNEWTRLFIRYPFVLGEACLAVFSAFVSLKQAHNYYKK